MSHDIKLRWPDDHVPESEFNLDFVQKMINRMAQSFHKRGEFRPHVIANQSSMPEEIRERLRLYEKTGNTEWLVDVGNCAMIEFTEPQEPKAHFRATSSHESPGVPTRDGRRVR